MGNLNCKHCNCAQFFGKKLELDLNNPIPLNQNTESPEPNSLKKAIPKKEKPNYELLKPYVRKIEALWLGHLARKHIIHLKRQTKTNYEYFSKSEIHEPLSKKLGHPGFKQKKKPYKYASGGVYTGQWLGGFRDGYGTMEWPNGAKYQGDWSYSKPNGLGKFTHVDGDSYEGHWKICYVSPKDTFGTGSNLENWKDKVSDGYLWLWLKQELFKSEEPKKLIFKRELQKSSGLEKGEIFIEEEVGKTYKIRRGKIEEKEARLNLADEKSEDESSSSKKSQKNINRETKENFKGKIFAGSSKKDHRTREENKRNNLAVNLVKSSVVDGSKSKNIDSSKSSCPREKLSSKFSLTEKAANLSERSSVNTQKVDQASLNKRGSVIRDKKDSNVLSDASFKHDLDHSLNRERLDSDLLNSACKSIDSSHSANSKKSFEKIPDFPSSTPKIAQITTRISLCESTILELKKSSSDILVPKNQPNSKFSQKKYSNGDVYIGETVNDIREGKGKLIKKGGEMYEGDWKEDKYHGKGKMTFPDGSKFLGFFDTGVKSGVGEYLWSTGDSYLGEWRDDLFHGHGRHDFSKGNIYTGQFEEGKKRGFGVMLDKSGNKYEGEFENDKKHGKGKLTKKSGKVINSVWNNGIMSSG